MTKISNDVISQRAMFETLSDGMLEQINNYRTLGTSLIKEVKNGEETDEVRYLVSSIIGTTKLIQLMAKELDNASEGYVNFLCTQIRGEVADEICEQMEHHFKIHFKEAYKTSFKYFSQKIAQEQGNSDENN